MRDYYNILDVDKGASDKEIKKAYRGLVKQYHPDRNSEEGAKEKYLEITEANDVLSDPSKRKLYDKFGEHWEQAGSMGFGGSNPTENHYEEIKKQYARQAAKGKEVHVKISLSLEDCFNGCKRDVPYSVNKICGSCNGNGSEHGTSHHECNLCGGRGERISIQRMGSVNVQRVVPCNQCHGAGRMIEKPCPDCTKGIVIETETAFLTFPRGVEMGHAFKVENKGHYSRVPGGGRGDAVFIIEEMPHPKFIRLGMDIVGKCDVSYEDLVLGIKINVPTVHGKETKIVVSPGTQSGKQYRIKGHGMPTLNLPDKFKPGMAPDKAFGDFIIELSIKIPESPSEEEGKLLEQLRNLRKNLDKVE